MTPHTTPAPAGAQPLRPLAMPTVGTMAGPDPLPPVLSPVGDTPAFPTAPPSRPLQTRPWPLWGALSLATLATLAACGSTPVQNPRLTAARGDLVQLQSLPAPAGAPSPELAEAETALALAEAAQAQAAGADSVEHLAYLAQQRVALARSAQARRLAEAEVGQAQQERDQLRLAARTAEVARAQAQTQVAQRDASQAQRDAQASQRDTLAAQRNADRAQRQATQAEGRADQMAEEWRALNARQTERGMVLTMGDVLFDSNHAELKPGPARSIDKLAVFMKAHPQRRALIEGFTDSQGSEAANQSLSTRRADAVMAWLVAQGVAADRLGARGYGEAFPLAGNDSPGGRQMNRRVEIVLSEDGQSVTPR